MQAYPMQASSLRDTVPDSQIHPSISERIKTYRKAQIDQVKALIAAHRVVVVGMSQNPFPKKARRLLDSQGIA